MHEISLVRSVFNTLEQEFSPEEVKRISKIDLKVGLLSNVEPTLMQNAFDAVVVSEKRFEKASLNIVLVPVKIKCKKCGEVAEVKNYTFKCSSGHPSRNIIQGTELLIERVHFEDG